MNNMEQVARTNQILRERIALGLTGGGRKGSHCVEYHKRTASGKKRCKRFSGSKRAKRVVARRAPARARRPTTRPCIDKVTRRRVRRVSELRCPPGSRARPRKPVGHVYKRARTNRACIDYVTERPIARTSAYRCPRGSRVVRGRGYDDDMYGEGDGLYENMYGGCEMDGAGVLIGGVNPRRHMATERSPWHAFVKDWADMHGMSYSMALRDHGQEVSRDYHSM
jgi:hypothetical protein